MVQRGDRSDKTERKSTTRSVHGGRRRAYDPIKRLIDLAASGVGLVLLAPVLLLVVASIRLTSRGPAIYRARRAGVGGEPFDVLKFRTMVEGADRHAAITSGADSRITAIGHFLRRTKLDELPQLWNILRGEMSLVGPRPESLSIVEAHFNPEYLGVLDIRPGLTCTGNLYHYVYQEHLEPPEGMGIEEFYVCRLLAPKISLDLHYVHHRSLLYDLRLILQTIRVMSQKILGLKPKWRPPSDVSMPADEDLDRKL